MYQAPTQIRPPAAPNAGQPATPEIPLPPEPQTLEQTGLTLGFLSDLALKTLYLRGQMTMAEIASSLGLPMQNITERVMEFLKTERLVEIRGGAGLSSANYQFVIIDRGSEKAQEALARSQYVGKAPVPLQMYIQAVQRQSIANLHVTQDDLVRAFAHMVIPLETLDLIYDETSKFYEAPFQMKANGGIFMVDDFGRQRVSPKDLLNRWIVPLEKRVDYLTLHTGKKIEIPFDMLIIFSTNLDPADLVDEAFLRRIRYKIGIEAPSVEQYDEIFKRICTRKNIDYKTEAMSQILAHYRKKNLGLRSCHPRDIGEQLIDTARFLGRPAQLTPDLIEMACDSYFVSLDPGGNPPGA